MKKQNIARLRKFGKQAPAQPVSMVVNGRPWESLATDRAWWGASIFSFPLIDGLDWW